MASLAIIVSLIFLVTILIGPICYLICSFKWMPFWIVYLLSALSIFVGIWWLILPINFIRFLGLLPIYCAYLSIKRINHSGKKTISPRAIK